MYFPRLFIDGADAAHFIRCFVSQEFITIHFLSKAKNDSHMNTGGVTDTITTQL